MAYSQHYQYGAIIGQITGKSAAMGQSEDLDHHTDCRKSLGKNKTQKFMALFSIH
jgi:hypothetical protein